MSKKGFKVTFERKRRSDGGIHACLPQPTFTNYLTSVYDERSVLSILYVGPLNQQQPFMHLDGGQQTPCIFEKE
jgi:hypothetical protein